MTRRFSTASRDKKIEWRLHPSASHGRRSRTPSWQDETAASHSLLPTLGVGGTLAARCWRLQRCSPFCGPTWSAVDARDRVTFRGADLHAHAESDVATRPNPICPLHRSLHLSISPSPSANSTMYWPTTAARIICVPPPLDERVSRVRPSRRGNLFATLADDRLGVWEVRPTVLQAAVVRSRQSVERWGANEDVFWAHDARSLVVLVSLRQFQAAPSARNC